MGLSKAAVVISLTFMILTVNLVSGQDFPNKPIRIVTAGTGGSSDFISRLAGQLLLKSQSWSVVVENRTTTIAAETVARATPDGYTLFVAGTAFWIGPFFQKTSYDPVKDFAPISLLIAVPNVLVVYPLLPAKSVAELIALAKAKPGELNYASTGSGGTTHLASELFKSMAGVNIVRINYKATANALNDLISGQVQMMFSGAGNIMGHIKSGRLRALAIASAQSSALVPGLPTVASVVPGYESGQKTGIFAPAGTPLARINLLNQDIVRVLNTPETKERLFNDGTEFVGSPPNQFAAEIKLDIDRLGQVIKNVGIKAE